MKKRIISFLILLTMLSTTVLGTTSNVVMAKTNENEQTKTTVTKTDQLSNETATMNEPSNKTYTLEELLNDEQEQNEIKRIIAESPKPAEENQLQEKAVLSAKELTYTLPEYNMDYVYGTDMPGYDYYIKEETRGNSTTQKTSTYFKIYKHDVLNNTNKLIYDATSLNGHYITDHVRDNIIYVLYLKDYSMYNDWGTEYSTCWVVGVDLKTEKVVMNQSFACPQDDGYFPSFAVDGEQRVYIPYRDTGLKIFDKTGKLLYDHQPINDPDGKYFNYIKGVSPNNKILFFEVMYRSWEPYAYAQTIYEGMQKLNNGVFVYKDEWTVYGRTYPSNLSQNPVWYFIDEQGNYAVDQYGRIAKFNYNVTNTAMGVDREIVLDLASTADDYGYYVGPGTPYHPNVCQNGDTVYILGAGGNIFFVDKNTLKYTKYIATGVDVYLQIRSISYYEQSIFVLKEGKIYQYKLNDSSNITTIKDITISENKTTSRTIPDIVAKYKQTSPKYDYSKSIYKTTPSWKSPYKAGSLQDGVVTDTINRLNYYRWLVGVDEIGVNTSKLDRNQKGAVISKANETISHYPTQPSDMDDAFYEEAYDGCNAKYEEGDTYSGNVSYGDWRPYQAIEGFVSDLYNVTLGSATGHRQSMLDPKATAISFGQCEEYSTVSVYYDDTKDVTSSQFYAFPSAGYFPNTEMAVSEYWSIYLTGAVSGTARVNFIYKGKTYAGIGLLFESGYPALSFRMPDELQNLLGSEYDNIPGGTEIQVEVIGLKDENLNNVTYKYTVNFFDMKSEVPSAEDVADLIFDYKFYADSYPDIKAVYGYNETALKNHWLTTGISEGRQGSAVFSPKYYVYNNKDIMNAFGLDYKAAYNHFITTGYAELRASSNEYYGKYYKNYTDLKDFSSYKLMKHYMEYGRQEGRKATNILDLTPIDIKPYLLDYDLYTTLEDNKDLKRAFGNDEGALKSHWETDGKREGRIASVVFDAKYYLNKYADLKKSYGEDYVKAYEHFITVGIYEGRQGSMYFNPKWYVENNTDIKETYGENYSKALEQFVNYGLKEGRRASAEFNVKQYRENYADLREAYGTNYKEYYKHYISYGKAEGRNGTTKEVRKLSELEEYLYNEEVYLSANGDIRELYKKDSTKTKNHWIEYGIRDGRKASLVFDAKWYLENNKDLKEAYGNDYTKAYNHFIEYGIKEGRQGSIYFNAKWYLENNADLKEVYGKDYTKALKHFVEYGAKEGRAGSKEFNCKKYKANYADLREAYGNDNIQYFLHYMNCGIKEGRKPI